MKLIIDPKVFEQHPDLKIGAIVIRGMNNGKRVSSVEALLRGVCVQRKKELGEQDIYENPKVQVWCNAYGKFGINPRKFPPSIAALLKRIKGGKEIPHINLLVDLYNYFSLKNLLPIGGEDLDWLCGDLNLTFTKGGEPFRPIGSIEVERAKEGELCYKDDGGITCRYWNYRECERTKFTSKTVNAVLLIEDLSKIYMDEFGAILQEIQNNIIKYIGGQITPYILNEENRTIDLGVEGRKNVDDSKVPQQEVAHYLALAEKAEVKVATAHKIVSTDSSPAKKKVRKLSLAKSPSRSKPNSLKASKEFSTESEKLFKQQVKKLLVLAVAKSFPELKDVAVSVEYPASAEHGDYACNIAMHLAKNLQKNPREIAEEIVKNFPKNEIVESVQVAGPGFINLFISEKILHQEVAKILKQKEKYGSTTVGKKKNIIVEYSQPNIAKPLGVHHLLSTIIGQSLYNIFQKLGFNAISINHIGDWGTQFGKLIYAYKNWGNKETIEKDPINELLKLYVRFHEEAEKNPALDNYGRKEFKDFEEGDKENRELWKWFVSESMKEIDRMYKKLGGIHFDHVMGESFYEDKMDAILQDGKKKGVFVEGKEGAYVINYADPNIPTLPIQKKDGATLYITRDFATLKYRLEHFKPVKILYVVDIAQSMFFKQLFEGAKMLGWYSGGQGEHVWFGRMHMKDGKMSTRKGNIILLEEVLDEAIKRATEVVEEKNPDLKNKLEVGHVIGVGSVKYNVLSQNRTTDITFDWDKMLSFESNSAPYLQYSYARAKSILRRKETVFEDSLTDPSETENVIKNLLRILPKYAEQIALAAAEYKPNIISNYLYGLTQAFNTFYNKVPVLKADSSAKRSERLKLVEAVSYVIKGGLSLLGVEVVEEM